MDNKNEKILEDINKLQGYKVTYQYATAINIKDNNMNPWFEKIEEILLNVKGVIRILSPDNPQVNYDNVNINEGLFDQKNIHGYKYKKYIFTPHIEITHENTLNLFF